jgi:hypothetical protein
MTHEELEQIRVRESKATNGPRADIPNLLEYVTKLERDNADLREQAERKVRLREDLKIALEEFCSLWHASLKENALLQPACAAGTKLVAAFNAIEQDGNV